ncbi:ABC-2 type transport system permease protein [Austwickia chelonae]|uniref:Uncharacterized protein n=1 Tax=Austwickia chelonae NBRC 105200 TaxID=1184607 RepID=K6VLE5_9MICO|nr:hypothetical protein [Austwickia chelonae]GAB77524.1 hypothetical protein AUCHE_05_04360 [Austwickia chelonae NBRC 105200]SEW12136.1 ABC-2 type transport system permease protein [Austwickia chelonae]
MVAVLVRLKLTLLGRSFRRSGWSSFGLVLAYLWTAAMVLPLGLLLVFARGAGGAELGAVVVPAFSLLTLGWLVLPLLFFGVDETLDPGRFALLPLPARHLLPGLVAASFIGAPGGALLALSLCLVIAWSANPATTAAAVVAVPLGAVTCILMSRMLTTALSGSLSSRRTKEKAAAIVAFGAAFLGIGMQLAVKVLSLSFEKGGQPGSVSSIVGFTSWSPFGWAWSVPYDLATGRPVSALVHLVLACALIVLLARWWEHSLDRTLVAPGGGEGSGEFVRDKGKLERLFGLTPRGAVAARVVRTFLRDSRLKVQLVTIAALPLIMTAPAWVGGASSQGETFLTAMSSAPFLAMMAGLLQLNSLAMDGTAVHAHVLAGLPGRDDRWGRVWAHLLLVGPLVLLLVSVTVFFASDVEQFLVVTGLTACLLFTGLGVSSWASAFVQWAVPPSDGNPFQSGGGEKAGSLVVSLMCLFGVLVCSLPVVILVFVVLRGSSWAAATSLVIGPLWGWGVIWVGCRWGGAVLDGRWPEALASMQLR